MSSVNGISGEKLGVLASGRGSNLQSIIDAANSGIIKSQIVCVLSDKKDAYALKRAEDNNIKAIHLDHRDYSSRNDYNMEVCRIMKNHGVTLVILAGFMRIVTHDLIDPYKNKIMNIHPSLLPSFPGLRGQKQALDYGVKIAGCTVHFVEEGMDEGPIIIQVCINVKEGTSEDELCELILKDEHKIYPEAIRLFEEGKLKVDGRIVKVS